MLKSINISELKKIISNINIIDIRNVSKYNDNHLPGAINIPKQILIKDYKKYLDKSKTYYIYCQSGISSTKICIYLNNLGYNVYNIIGGYENWVLNN